MISSISLCHMRIIIRSRFHRLLYSVLVFCTRMLLLYRPHVNDNVAVAETAVNVSASIIVTCTKLNEPTQNQRLAANLCYKLFSVTNRHKTCAAQKFKGHHEAWWRYVRVITVRVVIMRKCRVGGGGLDRTDTTTNRRQLIFKNNLDTDVRHLCFSFAPQFLDKRSFFHQYANRVNTHIIIIPRSIKFIWSTFSRSSKRLSNILHISRYIRNFNYTQKANGHRVWLLKPSSIN